MTSPCPPHTSKMPRKKITQKNIYGNHSLVPSCPLPCKMGKRGTSELQPWRQGRGWGGTAASPHYLDLLSEVLPAGQELVQRVLGVLHVAAVFPVDQEPGRRAHVCTHSLVTHRGSGLGLGPREAPQVFGRRVPPGGSSSPGNLFRGSVLSVWLPSPPPEILPGQGGGLRGCWGQGASHSPRTQGGPPSVGLTATQSGPRKSQSRRGEQPLPQGWGAQEGSGSRLQPLSTEARPLRLPGVGATGVGSCRLHRTPTLSAGVQAPPLSG